MVKPLSIMYSGKPRQWRITPMTRRAEEARGKWVWCPHVGAFYKARTVGKQAFSQVRQALKKL
jgi:hypothetical protein